MAGHSKWSKIKRKKAVNDQKRGKLLTKLLREVQVAAKMGGSNIEGNPRLKVAVQTAKSNSVPMDNIERAISRGAGDGEGVDYEEVTYEGYGPGGVAVLVKTLTDNRVRTVAEVRHAFNKCNGSLGSTNSVAYQFNEKGVFVFSKKDISEEELYEAAIEAGAEDVKDDEDSFEVLTDPSNFGSVRDALEALGKEFEGELVPIPTMTVKVEGEDAEGVLKLLDMLDNLDDVQNVVANFDMDSAELDRAS
ncbi:MAG: YebC/PmpR family DNA-binding transcriptional regulator [Bdellovibrionales bacterium]|nr:YebC/PmpR family DNA-binding transcriptional regulator [Bdellovibrionales bacterium]